MLFSIDCQMARAGTAAAVLMSEEGLLPIEFTVDEGFTQDLPIPIRQANLECEVLSVGPKG